MYTFHVDAFKLHLLKYKSQNTRISEVFNFCICKSAIICLYTLFCI